jgi:hypothetical protein
LGHAVLRFHRDRSDGLAASHSNHVERGIAKMITSSQIKSVRLVSLLACFALMALTEKARAQGVDNPLPLKLSATHKVKLYEDEQNYVRVSLPAGQYKAILDSRRTDGDSGNMTGSLSILNSDGAVTNENVIWFNYIDIVCRGVYAFSLKAPKTLILRLSNGSNKQTFWLTLLREPATSFLPFCDEVAPKLIKIGQTESGTLAENEFVYYAVSLTRGDYKVILDFANSANEKANLGGFFATLDGDGGNHKELFYLNEIDAFSRKTGMFSVRKDAALIFRIYNRHNQVNYKLTIQPSAP